MSHLDTPRLTFAGRFLSDVPTMNNNAESFGSPDPPPPGWNPYGGGTFDLLACKVTGGERAPGEPLGEGDPALGLNVLTARTRSPPSSSTSILSGRPPARSGGSRSGSRGRAATRC